MRCYTDRELQGQVMIYDSMLEIIEVSARENIQRSENKQDPYMTKPHVSMIGNVAETRSFRSWDDLIKACREPWKEGVTRVQSMLDKLQNHKLPVPKSRKRKGRWSDVDGDVDVDRVMVGEPEYNRLIKRDVTRGPTSVALLCNLDGYGGDTPDTVFWRGAAAIAAADLLEDAGYSCEIWMWCLGGNVYYGQNSGQFNTCMFKAAGDPIDINSIINGLSSWFMRYGLFGSFVACTSGKARSWGYPIHELGAWRKHMDITEGMMELTMPFVQTEKEAMEGAKSLLQQVIDSHE